MTIFFQTALFQSKCVLSLQYFRYFNKTNNIVFTIHSAFDRARYHLCSTTTEFDDLAMLLILQPEHIASSECHDNVGNKAEFNGNSAKEKNCGSLHRGEEDEHNVENFVG